MSAGRYEVERRFAVGQAVVVNDGVRGNEVGVVTKLHPMWEHCYWVIFEDGFEDLVYESNMKEVGNE